MAALEYSIQARDFVLSLVDRNAAPEVQLKQIYECFGSEDKITEAARQYCERENDLLLDQGKSADALIDPDDFESALEEEINEICEQLLRDVEVDEGLEGAKEAVKADTCWQVYAENVMEVIRSVKESMDDAE